MSSVTKLTIIIYKYLKRMKRERGGYITEVGKESIMGSWISTFVSRLESFFSSPPQV